MQPTAMVGRRTQSNLLQYWAPLDGLRAIAILLVMAFHAPFGHGALEPALFQGGFIGVDIFFVLSGALISFIVLTSDGPFVRFMARRILRLVPALLGVAIAAGVIAVTWQLPNDRRITLESIPTVLLYSSNFVEAFRPEPRPGLLSHAWSLAVEFQFYLLWPAVLMVLRRFRLDLKAILLITILGVQVCSAWRAILFSSGEPFVRTYFGFDTRFDSLLVGCGLAVLLLWVGSPETEWSRRVARIIGVGSVAFLAFVAFGLNRTSPFLYQRGGLTLVALAAAAIIYNVVAVPGGVFTAVLGWRPLVAIGKLSYSLYLWHWPVYFLTRGDRTGWAFTDSMVIRVLVTFGLATLSYFLIERPFMRLKDRGADIVPLRAPAEVRPLRKAA